MNTANLETSLASAVIFVDCMKSSVNYRDALNTYYNVVIKTKLATNKELYSEAKHIIVEDWEEISTFILYVSRKTCVSIRSMIDLLRNPYIVKFFRHIGWSFKELYRIVKKGYETWRLFVNMIEEYKKKNMFGRWNIKEYNKFEKWIYAHKKIKKFNPESISGMMVYVWLNMSFMDNIEWELDVADVIMAFSGTYTMENILSSNDGVNFVVTVSTMPIKFNFVYDKSVNMQFIVSTINTIAKRFKVKLDEVNAKDAEFEKRFLGVKNGSC